ncbi:MAG TPA: hypothetical protein VMU63_06875 [Acidimicrobiales bacterium]|nr:hypothetical protein [Acidimicrobiales bacterium]
MTFASGASSVLELIAHYEERGYTDQMVLGDTAEVTCGSCGTRQRAARYRLQGQRRTEGASDPDDMALVVALECPHCSARGTLALKYGPDASPEEAEVLRQLDG